MSLQVYLDGKLVPKDEARISVFDHGLLYGDGVFEGIRIYGGSVFLLAAHVSRLYESALAIRLEIPLSPDEMTQAVEKTVTANGIDDGYVRLVVTRGAGTLGQSFQATRVGGTVGLIGILAGAAGEVNPMPVLQKSIKLQGVYVGSRDMFDAMNAAMEINQIKPVIDKVYPFEQAQDALRCMEAATHFGKIVVTG